MRVAVLFDNFGPYHLARLEAASRRFNLIGIEVARQSGEYAWDPGHIERGFRSECLLNGSSRGASDTILSSRLAAILDDFKPEVISVPGWGSRAALSSLSWCCKHGVPVVMMSESQAIDELRGSGKEWVKRRLVGLCSSALVGGRAHADYLVQLRMPRNRVFLGYDAVDNAHFSKGAEQSRKQRAKSSNKHSLPGNYFLASARFIEKKNLIRLLQAYARYRELCTGFEAWDLVLLGDGELRGTLHYLRSTLRLNGNLHLPGFRQYPDLPTYYGLARAFIHASATEQWGLVVNEAMASGLPVLVSNRCGCAPDLLQEGVNGHTFDPFDVQDMADQMLHVANLNPIQLASLGNAGQRIIAGWGPERFASGLSAAVDKALEIGPKKTNGFDRLLLRLLIRRAR